MFERIVGHGDVLSLLENTLSGDPDGVYLFHGPKSVGKDTAAREFARMAVCSGTMDAGCACVNCRLFPDVPDFLHVGGSSRTIRTEDARSVASHLSLAPYSGPRRAVVIDDAETMNRQASYGLLKTLEEVRGAVVVLVASDEGRLSPAIKSRATPVRFGPLSPSDVSEILRRQGHSRANIEDVCRAMPFFSRSVLRDYARYSYYMEQMPGALKKLAAGAVDDVLSAAQEAGDAGESVHFAEAMLSTLSDVLKTHYDAPGRVSSQSAAGEIDALTARWADDVCIASCARMSEVLDAVRSPLNLKPGPRLFAALGWMAAYVKQSMATRGVE